jgi:AraC-like DNA-binding protein
VFLRWLCLSLDEQELDLKLFVQESSSECATPDAVLETIQCCANYSVPDTARECEKQLFFSDLNMSLARIRYTLAVASDMKPNIQLSRCFDWRVRKLMQHAKQYHRLRGLSLGCFSKQLRLSARHLGRLFAYHSRYAFRAYLRAVRMSNSCVLLREGSMSVKEISYLVGYDNEGNFCRDFRKLYEVTPITYRQLNAH